VAFAASFTLALSLTYAGAAWAYHTRFVANNCSTDAPQALSSFTRDGAINSALIARYEGYQWGGGCWNDNDVDDSPGDPTQDPNTGGEGGDCSGFTFKMWRESQDVSNSGGWFWYRLRNVHGPYSAAAFKSGYGAPNVTYYKSGLIRMDALASSSHIGMIYSHNADGTDQVLEAKGEAYGTNLWTRTYRGDPSFGGVRSLGWTG